MTFAFSRLAPNLRWVCPACERRLQRFKPSSTGHRSFTVASRRFDEDKSLASQPGQTQISTSATEQQYDYEPATTWDGLERVGGKAWRRKQQIAKPYQGFFSEITELDNGDPAVAVRRAVVEALVMTASGSKDITEFHELGEESDRAEITSSPDGSNVNLHMTRQDGNELSYEAIRISGSDPSGDKETSGPLLGGLESGLNSEKAIKGQKAWSDIPLRDPSFKFTVVKRVMQLIGKRISDPVIQRSNTAGELYNNLLIKPKPRKLFEELQDDETLSTLTNVKLRDRRLTPIDKETDAGRWKVIEQELLHRNLPVTGHGAGQHVR